ncbi:MAG: RtcB family protein, partial [Deltaproteobacteria bacterium]|nr:RtcB family protein [Deltaproteobacteria bacterium]
FDMETGVISPGGVGYDINCGCRLLRADLSLPDLSLKMKELLVALYQHVPSGVGSTSKIKLSFDEEKKVLKEGARWAVKHGYGLEEDLERTEDYGVMQDADPEMVSTRSLERGRNQLGTLGSGNHFLEVGTVAEVYDEHVANCFGLYKDQVTVLIHSGSRGFGYQVCDDFIKEMMKNVSIPLPDRQLVCTGLSSSLGRKYFSAMACAANYAWCNREILSHWTREVFEKVFQMSPKQLNLRLVYDVCHNIAKKEIHTVEGKAQEVCVHRKGATRAFPAGHQDVPEIYRRVGQPVLIPGDMGRCSYILVGTEKAMEETFGSTCHGAGRLMSRAQAKKASRGRSIARELEQKGILVMSADRGTLTEEIPEAYKDVAEVVEVVHQAGISRKVAKLKPLAVIKG